MNKKYTIENGKLEVVTVLRYDEDFVYVGYTNGSKTSIFKDDFKDSFFDTAQEAIKTHIFYLQQQRNDLKEQLENVENDISIATDLFEKHC